MIFLLDNRIAELESLLEQNNVQQRVKIDTMSSQVIQAKVLKLH